MTPSPSARQRSWRLKIVTQTRTAVNPNDQQSEVDIRIPSIRGALRWWFRALEGARLWDRADRRGGTRAFSSLAQVEAELFGMGGDGRNRIGKASKISLSLEKHGLQQKTTSFYLHKPNQDHWMKRPAITAGAFSLHGRVRGFGEPSSALDALEGPLWALTRLGGIGFRARRGYGSCVMDAQPIPLDQHRTQLKADLNRWMIGRGDESSAASLASRPPFPILHPTSARIRLLKSRRGPPTFSTTDDALTSLMKALAPFSHPEATERDSTATIPAFGAGNDLRFPRPHGGYDVKRKWGKDRIPSPLIAHVHPVKGDRGEAYVVVLTAFTWDLGTGKLGGRKVDLNDTWGEVDRFLSEKTEAL